MDALIRNLTNITLYIYIVHFVHTSIYNSTRNISKKRLRRITIDFCVCVVYYKMLLQIGVTIRECLQTFIKITIIFLSILQLFVLI
jgi:hypothetical protein